MVDDVLQYGKNLPTNHGSTFLNLNVILLLHYSGNIIHPFYSSRLDLFSYKISDLYFNTTVAVISKYHASALLYPRPQGLAAARDR